MKLLVKTTGSFMLVDPQNRNEIDYTRPAVVDQSNFIQSRVASGQLSVVAGDLRDTATDKEFSKYWKESDNHELAVQSFLSAFQNGKVEPEQVEEPQKPVKAQIKVAKKADKQ